MGLRSHSRASEPMRGLEPRFRLLAGRVPAALLALGPRPAVTHLLGVLAQVDAQVLEALLQLADVHNAVPVAVQRLKEGLVARPRLCVLAGRRRQHEAPQPAQHGPGGRGGPAQRSYRGPRGRYGRRPGCGGRGVQAPEPRPQPKRREWRLSRLLGEELASRQPLRAERRGGSGRK